MHKLILVTAASLIAATSITHAQVSIGAANNTDDVTKSGTFTRQLDGSSTATGGEYNSPGTFTGGVAGDAFSITMSTASNWTDAQAADEATFETYITSGIVAAVEIDNATNNFGVNSGTLIDPLGDNQTSRISLYGEALVVSFNSLSLDANTSLSLEQVTLNVFTAADNYTFVYHDASANTITSIVDSSATGSLDFTSAPLSIEDGDTLLIAMGENFTLDSGFRLSKMVVDMTTVPEPSTYALIGGLAALGVVVLRRRRK